MAAFRLLKWYLDCVTARGDATIAYTGVLRWGPVRLHYSSLLETSESEVREQHTLRQQHEPELRASTLLWRSSALQVKGTWSCASVPLKHTVFACDDGAVEWECMAPCARSRIGDREGLGYAERLIMTVPPWRLPIRTLRWGRFLSATDYIVWIDWLGDFNNRIVYRNGIPAAAQLISDGTIELANGARLTLDRSLVIRSGAIGSTALSVIPGVRETFPARLLQMNERKWRSRARLEQSGYPPIEGWAIHEVVEWPK